MGPSQPMNACNPPSSAISSSPGRRCRWYVFPSRIVVPSTRSSPGSTPFTVPFVPTGMNAGVGTSPCAVCSTPARAASAVAVSVKLPVTRPRTRQARARRSARLATAPPRGRARARGSVQAQQQAPRATPCCRAASPRALSTARIRRANCRARVRRACARTRAIRSRSVRSQDQHRIAEGVEAVLLFDRDLVQAPHLLDTRERHYECEQRRARQVEVRQQRVDAPELEAGRDEELGAAGERGVPTERLQRAYSRRADGEHALCRADALPCFRSHLVPLAVDDVVLEPLLVHRAEGVEADMQRDALDVEWSEKLRREVQPGGRRRCRAGCARIHGLVAVGLVEPFRDVRRQRCLALWLPLEPQPPAAVAEM